ncbi:hypothetical protein CSV86_014545 [Pseudomonas putida CSV86]|uniref:Uncharacterized protein n=1 Tax=Pseudomonas bharatica CSV86 TaxID=1005395 RepID=L1LWG5_9PSED|nr:MULTISPECIES: hypothetical protein [Pseudomonas]MDG9885402.1 hypothetical protein [Pseudomonas sp. GD04058]NNJ16345.1 hypothetical protein [Pseudomonas bharatica CSV86]
MSIEVTTTPAELGLFMALNAIALALKASPNFNNDALKALAEKFIREAPSSIQGAVAKEAYERPLRFLANDQTQAVEWLKQNGLA